MRQMNGGLFNHSVHLSSDCVRRGMPSTKSGGGMAMKTAFGLDTAGYAGDNSGFVRLRAIQGDIDFEHR
jgi:hypothetical protein